MATHSVKLHFVPI